MKPKRTADNCFLLDKALLWHWLWIAPKWPHQHGHLIISEAYEINYFEVSGLDCAPACYHAVMKINGNNLNCN